MTLLEALYYSTKNKGNTGLMSGIQSGVRTDTPAVDDEPIGLSDQVLDNTIVPNPLIL